VPVPIAAEQLSAPSIDGRTAGHVIPPPVRSPIGGSRLRVSTDGLDCSHAVITHGGRVGPRYPRRVCMGTEGPSRAVPCWGTRCDTVPPPGTLLRWCVLVAGRTRLRSPPSPLLILKRMQCRIGTEVVESQLLSRYPGARSAGDGAVGVGDHHQSPFLALPGSGLAPGDAHDVHCRVRGHRRRNATPVGNPLSGDTGRRSGRWVPSDTARGPRCGTWTTRSHLGQSPPSAHSVTAGFPQIEPKGPQRADRLGGVALLLEGMLPSRPLPTGIGGTWVEPYSGQSIVRLTLRCPSENPDTRKTPVESQRVVYEQVS